MTGPRRQRTSKPRTGSVGGVRIRNPIVDLFRDRQRFVDGNGSSRNVIGQCLAFDQLHDQGADATAVFESVDGCDVRMV